MSLADETESTDDAPGLRSPEDKSSLGSIEVVVLRCAGPRSANTPSNTNLDGAGDTLDQQLGADSRSRITSLKSVYDDRDPFTIGRDSSYYSTYRPETVHTPDNRSMRSRRKTTHDDSSLSPEHRSSHRHSRYTISISPRKRNSGIPSPGFQYGSGPIPKRSIAESERDIVENLTPDRAVTAVDSGWLDQLITDVGSSSQGRATEELRRKSSLCTKLM
jgi:hypothetical protein